MLLMSQFLTFTQRGFNQNHVVDGQPESIMHPAAAVASGGGIKPHRLK